MKRIFFSSLLLILLSVESFSQSTDSLSNATLRHIGYHTGNRIGISFYNDGQIAGFNVGTDIRGEWPLGSGENYIGDMTPLIGAEFINSHGDTIHSVAISRGPRNGQGAEVGPNGFRGFNPRPGYRNPNGTSVAMSHIPTSWPIEGWHDQPDWKDLNGVTQWNGYFGRGIVNADQESYFVADDQADDEFNANFSPDSTNPLRKGMALKMSQRGFQWANFLAEDCLFWLYDIKNEGTTTYRKTVFGTVVGTLAGGDGDSGDDLGFFDINDAITYSWDSDNKGNKGQKVGYVAYAFLESPGNPTDGIDNDADSQDPSSPQFTSTDFDSIIYRAGDKVVLIDPVTYTRTIHTVVGPSDTVYSLGVKFIIVANVTKFREGNIDRVLQGVSIPSVTSYDGIDNDLDGLVDENKSIHYDTRVSRGKLPVKHINYLTHAGENDPLIDEQRDNDAGTLITSYVKGVDGQPHLAQHWSGDEDGDWDAAFDDVGADGVGPLDNDYFGPDADGTEGNGKPDQGEPNFGKTDPDESDQIGLTSFNFFNQTASPPMNDDGILWDRMRPGRFDVVPAQPQDGDFIYASGYFPLRPKQTERFSVSLLFGENYDDVVKNKKIVQQIYNSGYKFPQPPRKPRVQLTQLNGKVIIYWDGSLTEASRDFITKKRDFQGYKIYRATDAGFQDARLITDALGVLAFDKPIAQFDKNDSIKGYFHPSGGLLDQVGGTTYWLGNNTGIVQKYVDSNVVLGQRYFYAVCSYDQGEEALDIFPTENSKFIFQTSTGQIITDDNTGYITPGVNPAGYVDATSSNLIKSPNFKATGSATIEMIDEQKVRDGNQYQIVFSDTGLQQYTSNWSLVDLTAPDTVIINTTGEIKLAHPGESISVPYNQHITVNGKDKLTDTTVYTGNYDTLIVRDTLFSGNTPVNHGFRVQIQNDKQIIKDTLKSGYEGTNSIIKPTYLFEVFTTPTGSIKGIPHASDYRIEFSNSFVDTSIADTVGANTPGNRFPTKPMKFKVKNLSTDQYIDVVYYTSGTVSTSHNMWFKEVINGIKYRTWKVNIFLGVGVALDTTGYLNLYTTKPFNRDDFYTFTMHGAHIDAPKAKNQLDEIKVVPNPYVVTHQAEPRLLSTQTSGRGERFIRFTHVPPNSTITIFTVRGERVKQLRQEDLYNGDVKWNLRTEENLDAAFGVYVYVVESSAIGTKTGKFALIK